MLKIQACATDSRPLVSGRFGLLTRSISRSSDLVQRVVACVQDGRHERADERRHQELGRPGLARRGPDRRQRPRR